MIKKQAELLVNDNMMQYSSFVLLSRSLPDLRDGLKPVHRRILYSMRLNKTTKLTKSATVSGRIMDIHSHGDTYPAIVNLVQKDRQNIPFLEGKGSWGQFTSNRQGAAASRYTEVKLGKPAIEMMKELKNESVDYAPNYDGTIMVPEVLPVTYPTVLTQANSGIGVGFASETLSYNIHDIKDVISEYLESEKLDDILIPDFPTGGFIVDSEANHKSLADIMHSGKGSFVMRAKAHFDENKIIVTEIPYGVKREQIMARIIKLNKDKKLPEVTDVRDGTSFTGMKIVITLRKNANPEEVLQKLYLNTPLQANISANMNMLHHGIPQVLGVYDIIKEWTQWRKEVIVRGFENEIHEIEDELHLLKGLQKILLDIDNAISIIRHSKNDTSAIKNLSKEFEIDDTQAKHVANIRIINLNEDKIKKQLLEIKGLEKKLSLLKSNIKKDKFINSQLIKTMDESIQQMDVSPRKTTLLKVSTEDKKVMKTVIKESAKVESYLCTVMLTREGYLFKERTASPQAASNLLRKLRLGDKKESFLVTENDKSLCVFLENGKVGRIKVSDIDLETGIFIPNVLESQIANVADIFEPTEEVFLILGFSDGQLVRVPTQSYAGNNRIMAKGYRTEAELIFIDLHYNNQEGNEAVVNIQHSNENGIKREKLVKVGEIPLMKSRVSRGKNFLKPKENHKIEISLAH